jgi:phospholipid/cholesterol/gamma-HCH transport system substrate-binding protein
MRGMASERRVPNWAIGLALLLIIVVGSVLAYLKQLPFGDPYEVRAVFSSATNVRTKAPVRIAGVQVGEVTGVEHLTSDENEELASISDSPEVTPFGEEGQQAAVVTMEITEEGQPLFTDATFRLRPRLFLEGNLFVEVHPGSPNAEGGEVEDDYTFPITQTSVAVQLDQILTTLQSDVRQNLQVALDQFGNALIQYGGAEGFRELYRTSPAAFRYTAEVNAAFLGTDRHDLSGLVKDLDSTVRALGRNEAELQNLVTNLRIVTGSFAAEDEALEQAVAELPRVLDAAGPALTALNDSFPALRAFSREALPGVRSTPATLEAATPFIRQVRQLVSRRELRGLVADLRPTIPRLALLARRTLPFLDESRALSSCFNEVVIPWSNDTVEPTDSASIVYPHDPVGRVFEETAFSLEGIGSESRSGDANAQYVRVEAGGGTNTVQLPVPSEGIDDAFGVTDFPIEGAMPRISDSVKTPFRPDVACETQEQPDLAAGLGAPPTQTTTPAPTAENLPPAARAALEDLEGLSELSRRALELREEGDVEGAEDLEAEIAREYMELARGADGENVWSGG